MILESIDVSKNSVEKIIDAMKELSGTYDKTIDDINFWCDGDEDGTIFIQYKDGYATLTNDFVKTVDKKELVDSVIYQLNNTIADD